jgi:hypothetical protein
LEGGNWGCCFGLALIPQQADFSAEKIPAALFRMAYCPSFSIYNTPHSWERFRLFFYILLNQNDKSRDLPCFLFDIFEIVSIL